MGIPISTKITKHMYAKINGKVKQANKNNFIVEICGYYLWICTFLENFLKFF